MFNIDEASGTLDDPLVYDLICSGKLKGCFQAESHLVQSTAKKILPRDPESLALLISIVRPGCYDQLPDYLAVRNGEKEMAFSDERLRDILSETGGIILYQEQLIRIGERICSFTESESDSKLRKPVGKKQMDVLKKVGPEFISRAVDGGMEKEAATTLWDIIVKSGDYQFCRSHGFSYMINMYQSAYLKVFYKTQFYWANLMCSNFKQDQQKEIQELAIDMKDFGVKLNLPKLSSMTEEFEIIEENEIVFGIKYIKGMGSLGYKQLLKIKHCKTWREVLISIVELKVAKNRLEPAICSGVLDELNVSRTRMLGEHNFIHSLSIGQRRDFIALYKSDETLSFKEIINKIFADNKRFKLSEETEKCLNILDRKLEDSNLAKDMWERKFLGVNLSCSRIDMYSDKNVNSDCAMVNKAKYGQFMFIGLLESCNKVKTHEKKLDMAFIKASDSSGVLDSMVVFPDVFAKAYYKDNILRRVGNEVLLVNGYKKEDSFIVTKLKEL